MRRIILFSLFILSFSLACSKVGDAELHQSLQQAQKPWGDRVWWKVFQDPLINQSAEKLLEQNIDIKIAAARLAEARAILNATQAGLFPDVTYTGLNSGIKNQFLSRRLNLGVNGALMRWEADIFGQTQAGIKAANAQIGKKAATIDDLRNLLIADLATAIIDWRQALESIKLIQRLLRVEKQKAYFLKKRNQAGLIDASYVERAGAAHAQSLAQLSAAIASAKTAEYQMERLLADTKIAQGLKQTLKTNLIIPEPKTIKSISIHSIQNRPDVRIARFGMLAAQAELTKAERELLPKISIYAFFGLEHDLQGLRVSGNPVWALSSIITTPVINFGRLRAAVAEKNAASRAAELIYENTIRLAIQETKTALSDYLNRFHASEAQTEALKQRQKSFGIIEKRFQLGLTDMSVLESAEAELIRARLTLVNSKAEAATAFIRFQKALGLTPSIAENA